MKVIQMEVLKMVMLLREKEAHRKKRKRKTIPVAVPQGGAYVHLGAGLRDPAVVSLLLLPFMMLNKGRYLYLHPLSLHLPPFWPAAAVVVLKTTRMTMKEKRKGVVIWGLLREDEIVEGERTVAGGRLIRDPGVEEEEEGGLLTVRLVVVPRLTLFVLEIFRHPLLVQK